MSSATRWAGVPLADRRVERRSLLISAAFTLFGEGGEAAVSVRSVCRKCGLNTRYFYESFGDVDELLGAVYDKVALELGEVVGAATGAAQGPRAKICAGITAVLGFSSVDPRRGRILFTDAPTNPVLAGRRAATQEVLTQLVVTADARHDRGSDQVSAQVGAALFTGAMSELVRQWLSGKLGGDLNGVVDYAVSRVLGE